MQDILSIYNGARDFPVRFENLLADKRKRTR